MKTLNDRQKQIRNYIRDNTKVKTSDILSFIQKDFKIDRRTVIRDLDMLQDQKLIVQHGKGRGVFYTISKIENLLSDIDIEEYFLKSYLTREVKENFNFDIFQILENDIFTKMEYEKLENLQNQFVKNFSSYNSQTLINKEFERIMIEFSWKSSAIEGNTYSLLSTEALIKENIKDDKKTKED